MSWIHSPINPIFMYALIILVVECPALCQESKVYGEGSGQLVLDIYVDSAGKALITGYAGDVKGLAFLNSSEYDYVDTSRQLSAITNTLTSKSRDNWSLNFDSEGSYDEYHAVFYLPIDAKLKAVSCSDGLEYLIYTSNDSLIIDTQGYDIVRPATNIEYRLPLTGAAKTNGSNSYHYLIASILFVSIIGVIAVAIRFRSKGPIHTECHEPLNTSVASVALNSEQEEPVIKTRDRIAEDGSREPMTAVTPEKVENPETAIEIAAIMSTLTEREQSVFKALLQRGGRMTQAEIKYETGISKSSLSGILTSMEKRKLITKKECGRTNAIEISERFSSRKEHL